MRANFKVAAIWFVAAFSGGAVGGFGGAALATWLSDEPKVLGGNWWDVMTAFGTVGSAALALFFWIGKWCSQRATERAVAKNLAARLVIGSRGTNYEVGSLDELKKRIKSNFGQDLAVLQNDMERFEAMLDSVFPFYTEKDCLKLSGRYPKLAGSMAIVLGCSKRLKDLSLRVKGENGKYGVDNFHTLGVAIETMRAHVDLSMGFFYELREEMVMGDKKAEGWKEWLEEHRPKED